MLIVAIVSMVVISVAHHLGFVEKAYAICGEIAKCAMCSTMWGTLAVLLICGCHIFEAIALSFFVAYASNWFGLILGRLAKLYDKLWQKSNK
jgi:hypothetical protein